MRYIAHINNTFSSLTQHGRRWHTFVPGRYVEDGLLVIQSKRPRILHVLFERKFFFENIKKNIITYTLFLQICRSSSNSDVYTHGLSLVLSVAKLHDRLGGYPALYTRVIVYKAMKGDLWYTDVWYIYVLFKYHVNI